MPKTIKYDHVIWDWNGTLLDDANLCLNVINELLSKRNLRPIRDIAAYREIFGFPVMDYYRRAGFDFDKEPFEIPAKEFVRLYHSDESRFRLFGGAKETLAALCKMGAKQVILSASETNNLRSQTDLFDIGHYFEDILGISDIYAESKIDIGKAYIAENCICGSRAVLIGDTAHDHEAAKAMGVDCILISNGHQNKNRLLGLGVPVLGDIREVLRAVK
ncbi:MAG: HAD family hydrolase [Oscillospiraceae bacterium]|nr:HAD family hydrolase [Oscillospiraceae bacterium]